MLPGGIDPHVHPGQNFTTESAAALAGGTTTISTMVSAGNVGFGGGRAGGTPPPPNPFADEDLVGTIQRTDEKIKKEAMADFILHVTINDPQKRLNQLEGLVKIGQPSIKIFMNRAGFVENERAYVALIRKAGEVGVLPLIHCEDDTLINNIGERFIAQGKADIRNVPQARPVLTEEVGHRALCRVQRSHRRPRLHRPHLVGGGASAGGGWQGEGPADLHRGALDLPVPDRRHLQAGRLPALYRPAAVPEAERCRLPVEGRRRPHRGRRRHRSQHVHQGAEDGAADHPQPPRGHERAAGLPAGALGRRRALEEDHPRDISSRSRPPIRPS